MTPADHSFKLACSLMAKRADAWSEDPAMWTNAFTQPQVLTQPVNMMPVGNVPPYGPGIGVAGTFGASAAEPPAPVMPLPAGTAAPYTSAPPPVLPGAAPAAPAPASPGIHDMTGRFRPSWSPSSGILTSTNPNADPNKLPTVGEKRMTISQWGTGSNTFLPPGTKVSDPATVQRTKEITAAQSAPPPKPPGPAPAGSWGDFKPKGTLAVTGGRVQMPKPAVQLPPSSGLSTSGPGGKMTPRRI